MKLAPSILAADMTALGQALDQCEAGGADLIHFDVMDGHFVPNLTFGIPVLEAVVERSSLPVDVHLMVSNPDALLDRYLKAKPEWISVHWEASVHLDRTLNEIRKAGIQAGVALNPATSVDVLRDVLPSLDYVVLMSVNPGFSGQPFLPYVLEKARRLREMIEQRGLDVLIEMDGGLGPKTIRRAVEAGVELCVAGSAVFADPDPPSAMGRLKELAKQEMTP